LKTCSFAKACEEANRKMPFF